MKYVNGFLLCFSVIVRFNFGIISSSSGVTNRVALLLYLNR